MDKDDDEEDEADPRLNGKLELNEPVGAGCGDIIEKYARH